MNLRAVILVFFIASPALADEHEWISKYRNTDGINCCGPKDTFLLDHGKAASLTIGSPVVVQTPSGYSRTIFVDSIHPSEDPQGRDWITSFRS